MRALVTGAAGFIGSHVVEELKAQGAEVTAIDCMTPYYDRSLKEENAREGLGFVANLRQVDLCDGDLVELFEAHDVVYHLAGQPGVRASWSDGFGDYLRNNVLATQRVLEASRIAGIGRVVYASSSSIYGNADQYPAPEGSTPAPYSPYGVTKLAGEHLCGLYASNFGLSTVSLRYFTVFGPRQRPDLAIMKLIVAAESGTPFPLFGTGSQVRDFTFVSDVVGATLLAGGADVRPGSVFNVAGGAPATMNEVIALVGAVVGAQVVLSREGEVAGDVRRTGGMTERIRAELGWRPRVSLEEGVERQVRWFRKRGLDGRPRTP